MKIIIFLLLFVDSAFSVELKMNGFVNMVYSGSDSVIPYNSNVTNDGSFLNDSVVGLNLHSKFKKDYFAQFQFLVAEDPGNEEIGLRVSQAFMGHIYKNKLITTFGKLFLPVWNFSEYKYVGSLYPWIRPPEEVYSIFKAEDVFGIGAEYRHNFSNFFNKTQFVLGTSKTKLVQPDFYSSGVRKQSTFHYEGPTISINNELKYKKLVLRLAYTHLEFDSFARIKIYTPQNSGVDLETTTELQLPKLKFDFYSGGFQYHGRFLSIHSEIAHGSIKVESNDEKIRDTLGGYFSMGTYFKKVGFFITAAHQRNKKFVASSIQTTLGGEYKVNSLSGALNYSFSEIISMKAQVKESKFYDATGISNSSLLGSDLEGSTRITTYGVSLNAMF